MLHFLRIVIFCFLISQVICIYCHSQCNSLSILKDLQLVKNNPSINNVQKRELFFEMKDKFENCKLGADSVYAMILNEIGIVDFQSKKYLDAIYLTTTALRINLSSNENCSRIASIENCSLIAHYYDQLFLFSKAINYYDTCITLASQYKSKYKYIADARLFKAYIYFRLGDYEKDIEESTIGLNFCKQFNDTLSYLRFLNQRGQGFFFENNLVQANADINLALVFCDIINDTFQKASAFKIKALIEEKNNNYLKAKKYFESCVAFRLKTKRYEVVASDYNDFANFYKSFSFSKAIKYYNKAQVLAKKKADSGRLAMININIGRTYVSESNFRTAINFFFNAFNYLKLNNKGNFFENPKSAQINLLGNKTIVITAFQNKMEMLLEQFGKTKTIYFLQKALNTALLIDTVITQIRQEQLEEQSKLFWRDQTRQFYSRTIEACYLANNPSLAFYFMEKSRAVLLNDKLNEIGATAQLPASEAAKQENLQINIVEQQQKLYSLDESSPQYTTQQILLLKAKDDYEHYIKSLEQKYPVYYQYKYADEVPSLDSLKKYLTKNNQSFVDYFLGDTVTYILSVTPTTTKFIKLSKEQFNKNQLNDFIQYCSNKELLNNHYNSFAKLAQNLYNNLFGPLQIQKGSIIICPDNFLIPFEALCTDADGKNFLLTNFSFTYVYSARYFLAKQNITTNVSGNFIGMAPVSFSNYLKVPDLINSGNALTNAAENYSRTKILIQKNATRKNFFQQIGNYNIANIFSHAYADSTNSEPKLYMQDSVIRLSELQFINHPATQIVVLSACETNVGKNATGEGIYSLARGFASVGVPSVSATLWKADEETIYSITELFNKNLAAGMQKDVALQQAKLTFLQNNQNEKLLPYFWANMVLVGNTEPVSLSKDSKLWLWLTIGSVLVLIILALFYFKRTNK